ncbi:MAG: YkvA family protein [Anaerolineae bacterium]
MIATLRRRAGELKRETYALYLAYRDPRTPWIARIIAGCVVAYAFSPLDLIPDFVPVLGYLDDLVLVPLGVALALRLIPPDVLAESRARARNITDRPTNRAAAAVIVAIWLALAVLAVVWAMKMFGRG